MSIESIRKARREAGLPHWKPSQRKRLQDCINAGATIAYWNSDTFGRPTNGGTHDGWQARVGLVQEIPGPLEICGAGALHATLSPHKWKGTRVWVVALHGEVKRQEDKFGALRREFLGEILPEEGWVSASVAVRVGADLRGANLEGANLRDAYLRSADLRSADLRGAYLRDAYLRSADLMGAHRGNYSSPISGWRTLATGYLEKK